MSIDACHAAAVSEVCLHNKLGGEFTHEAEVSKLLTVTESERGLHSVQAACDIAAGTVLFTVHGELMAHPNSYSVQFSEYRHCVVPGFLPFESLSHSCNPNCRYVIDAKCPIVTLVALSAIPKGQTITVNYCTSEWDISNKFDCHCGSEHCYGKVQGFLYLSCAQRRALLPHLSPYLQKRMEMLIDVDALVAPKLCPSLGPKCSVVITQLYGKTVVALEFIAKGTKIYECRGEIFDHPTMYTVQLDETRHINCVLGTCECTAHSCTPTAYFEQQDHDSLVLVAARDIGQGEQVTFNYLSNEWNMATPFQCLCGNQKCFGFISGFKNVAPERREELVHLLSPYVREMAIREGLIAAPAPEESN